MGFGDNDDPSNELKKHLDKAEQRINAKFQNMLEQMTGQASETHTMINQHKMMQLLMRIGVTDRITMARDLALVSNELEVLQMFLAEKFPELRVLFENRKKEKPELILEEPDDTDSTR
jgi:hypothetical protein